MYYLMLAREYFIYHKQCHKHHKYMLYVLRVHAHSCLLLDIFIFSVRVHCGTYTHALMLARSEAFCVKLVNQFSTVILLVLYNESRSICVGKIKDITYPFFK